MTRDEFAQQIYIQMIPNIIALKSEEVRLQAIKHSYTFADNWINNHKEIKEGLDKT